MIKESPGINQLAIEELLAYLKQMVEFLQMMRLIATTMRFLLEGKGLRQKKGSTFKLTTLKERRKKNNGRMLRKFNTFEEFLFFTKNLVV